MFTTLFALMPSQGPQELALSRTQTNLEPENAVLENGRARALLDYIVTESTNPATQKDQGNDWQVALLELANVLLESRRTWPGCIVEELKSRFPAAIAAYKHPLSSLPKQGSMRCGLLCILVALAEMALSDETLYKALNHHRIPEIAVVTWLSDHDPRAQETKQQAYMASFSCMQILRVFFRDHERFIPPATATLGSRPVAKQLAALLQQATDHQLFSGYCFIATHIVNLSDPQVSCELLRSELPVKVSRLLWEVLARSPEADDRRAVLSLGLSFISRTMEHPSDMHGDESISVAIKMVQSCDLVSLCSLVMYSSARVDWAAANADLDEEFSLPMASKRIMEACVKREDLVPTHVLPHLIPFLDYLPDLVQRTGGDLDKVIKRWADFAAALEEHLAETSEGWMEGCSWYQCILHPGESEGATRRAMLLDNSCKRVQYCSRYCQKRDWNDGGHREVCTQAENGC